MWVAFKAGLNRMKVILWRPFYGGSLAKDIERKDILWISFLSVSWKDTYEANRKQIVCKFLKVIVWWIILWMIHYGGNCTKDIEGYCRTEILWIIFYEANRKEIVWSKFYEENFMKEIVWRILYVGNSLEWIMWKKLYGGYIRKEISYVVLWKQIFERNCHTQKQGNSSEIIWRIL